MAETESTGNHPEVPRVAEAVKTDLASKIQSSFDAVMGNDTDDAVETPAADEPAAETSETEQAAEATEAATAQDEPEASADETTDATADNEAAAPAKGAPTLPAAYVRSLKALEWTEAEIAEAAKNPSFITTAAKLHATRNKEVAEWAKLGRAAKEQQSQSQQAQTAQPPLVLKPVDAKALKAKYGDEPLIDEIVGPVNAMIEQLHTMLPVVQQTQSRAQQAQLESMGRQIDSFFSGKDMEPYKDEYGTESAKLNEKQLDARKKVLEFADALVGGATQQGRQLSVDQALQMAHDATSGGTKVQAARQQITKQLQARAKGLTLRPGARGSNVAKSGSRSDLEKRVRSGLSAVLG